MHIFEFLHLCSWILGFVICIGISQLFCKNKFPKCKHLSVVIQMRITYTTAISSSLGRTCKAYTWANWIWSFLSILGLPSTIESTGSKGC